MVLGREEAAIFFFSFFLVCSFPSSGAASGNPNYRDALAKSILFFEGQRSGPLPHNQGMPWRFDSGLYDGKLENVDLTGGYYDAGDNVKFNFPMAYTTTMLSWGILENGKRMGDQLGAASDAVRWGADYFLKSASGLPDRLFVGVGDPNADHRCWERPEDMDTPRSVYFVTPSKPGSDVAAETAAALAAASLVFRSSDPAYATKLLSTARVVYDFAAQHLGAYSDSLGSVTCPFYCSYSGYQDELLWGAAWLFHATNEIKYLNIVNAHGTGNQPDIFSWDNKYAGAYVLLSRRALLNNDKNFFQFKEAAENFVCRILPHSPSSSTQYTQGGLMFKLPDSNLQYVTAITSLLTTYSKYMSTSSHTFNCGSLQVTPLTLRLLAKQQVDYILGVNPLRMSFMVGFGDHYPQRIHHRGASIPSVRVHLQKIGCEDGFDYFHTQDPNPNDLVGAIVGGPSQSDGYPDARDDYSHSEPATYINGALVGSLAYLSSVYPN